MMDSKNIELAQNKLLILYIINGSDNLFNDELLTKFVLEMDLLNFFFFKQYTEELINNNFIYLDSNLNYHMTKDGLSTLEMFIDELPENTLIEIQDKLKSYKKDIISEKSIVSKYYKDDYNRFYVNLAIKEALVEIFSLHLEVPTEEYAKKITTSFKSAPDKFYLNFIKILDT